MRSSIRSIFEAGLGRRLLAMIMDGALFAFVSIALALWVFNPIVQNTMHYSDLGVQGLKYEVFSKLYVVEETLEDNSKRVVPPTELNSAGNNLTYTLLYYYNSNDVDFYKERIKYYYCSYKTGENLEVIEGQDINDFRSPEYNNYIKDNSGNDVLPKDYYTEEWFNKLIEGKSTIDDFKNLSYEAVKDLRESKFFMDLNTKIGNCQLVMVLPAVGISFLSFYVLVPLLYRNGETFGKKVMKIGFVTKDGFDVKKRQIVFRQLLLLVWAGLSSFIVGIGLTSLATLGLGMFIYLVIILISKTKRSAVDYAAYTYLICTDKSVWFKDKEEEEKKEIEVEEKMSKYQRYEPDKSHIIQVGSEIVNEDVKKEIEEEKLKKSKK